MPEVWVGTIMIPILFEHDGSWENTLVKVDGATPKRWLSMLSKGR